MSNWIFLKGVSESLGTWFMQFLTQLASWRIQKHPEFIFFFFSYAFTYTHKISSHFVRKNEKEKIFFTQARRGNFFATFNPLVLCDFLHFPSHLPYLFSLKPFRICLLTISWRLRMSSHEISDFNFLQWRIEDWKNFEWRAVNFELASIH